MYAREASYFGGKACTHVTPWGVRAGKYQQGQGMSFIYLNVIKLGKEVGFFIKSW